MQSFIAIYRNLEGKTAKLIVVVAEPRLVAYVAGQVLKERGGRSWADPVSAALERGRCEALRQIRREAIEAQRKGIAFQVIDTAHPGWQEPPQEDTP